MIRQTLTAAALLAAFTAPAAAQDVIEIGRRNGVEAPAWIRRELARNPSAFEFRHAWKPDLRRVQEARARLAARGIDARAVPTRTAARYEAAVSGVYRVPTLTVLFANTPAEPYPYTDLQARLYDGPSATLTLSGFYDEMSRGVFDLRGTVFPWVRLSQPDTYYEGTENGSVPELGELIAEAVDSLDATVDFSVYDRNADGKVDFIAIIHPEPGGECRTENIWSHRWTYSSASGTGAPLPTDDGVVIEDYVIQPAFDCDGATPVPIGVFAHEFGHALGLPDLYATDYSNGGIDLWGLMGAGNYNRPESPAHLSAYSKSVLGWIPVVTVDADTTGVALEDAATTGVAIRIDIPAAATSNVEYFLLENRQGGGSDRYVRGTGLLIWHVDSTVIANRSPTNTVQNDANHKGLDLEEADGLAEIDMADAGIVVADAGDPFPGTRGNTVFDDATNPAASAYGGLTSGIRIANIVESGGTVSFDVTFGTAGERIAYWGDVDGDGAVTRDDAQAVFEALLRATGGDLTLGDVDADGDTDARDGLIIQSYAEGVDVSGFRVGQPAEGMAVRRPAPARIRADGASRRIPVANRRTGGL